MLHYIDDTGETHSVQLKERILHEKEGVRVLNRRCVKDIWILRHGCQMAIALLLNHVFDPSGF